MKSKYLPESNGLTRLQRGVKMATDPYKVITELEALVNDAKLIITQAYETEVCDHEVGVCYCGVFDWLDRVDRFQGGQNAS